MTYSAVYCALISKRLSHPLNRADGYVERHHIIPKSEGGSDEPDNLVNLTAREHYIAHKLLAKIYDDTKMWNAFTMMVWGHTRKQQGRRELAYSSRDYQLARSRLSAIYRTRRLDNDAKRRISLKMKKLWRDGEYRDRTVAA